MIDLTRRSFGQLLAVAAVPSAAAGGGAGGLDLTTPAAQLDAWLKVYVSLEHARIWYWYTGVIDASVPGGPVLPLFGVDTLIRREIVPLGASRYRMEMFEGSYFHAIGDPAPLDRWTNPLNGREVRPFHYREGPYQVGYDAAGAFDPKMGERYPGPPPFATPWHRAGEQIWFSRDLYIDVPHPLPIAEWPMEASGPRETFGSFATHWASQAEVADPAVKTAASAFHYQAFMGWLPWMLMAQAPRRMIWARSPSKLDDRPWTDFANMAIDYRRERTPALR